jgi:aspartate/methionine/tyrosine aminotransferase
MEWAKLSSRAKFNLATSGVAGLPLAELGVRLDQLEINGASIYGYAPLRQAVALRYRVPETSVVSAIGTSMANYLALAATTESGDEILVEHPTYEPIVSAARYLGLRVVHFQRPAESNFDIDLAHLARQITPQTRVIVLTNLHNPSGALCPDTTLREIAALARDVGAFVMLDEVYREMLFEGRPQTAFHLDPERFVITNSLTKAYGLSGLRCGWLLAPPALAERMWHIIDLHGATFPHPTELLSVIAFEKLEQISTKTKAMLDENRRLLQECLKKHASLLEYFWPEYGTLVFPRLRKGNSEDLCGLLRRDFETSVVPGRFFDAPDRFRIGIGLSTEAVRDALQQLSSGLEAYERQLAVRS